MQPARPLPSNRDPRTDPQPGDELLGLDGLRRRVFRRNGEVLQIGDAISSYRMRLDHWREWCEKSEAQAVSAEN